jgi:hypothetical protein
MGSSNLKLDILSISLAPLGQTRGTRGIVKKLWLSLILCCVLCMGLTGCTSRSVGVVDDAAEEIDFEALGDVTASGFSGPTSFGSTQPYMRVVIVTGDDLLATLGEELDAAGYEQTGTLNWQRLEPDPSLQVTIREMIAGDALNTGEEIITVDEPSLGVVFSAY